MKVYIGEVKKEVGRTSHEVCVEDFKPLSFQGEKIIFARPVQVELDLVNCKSEILLEGWVKTGLVLNCSRCLKPFVYEAIIPFRLECRNVSRLVRPSDLEAEFREADEVAYFFEDENFIDITWEVRETLLLGLPMKPLCRDSCQGICPVCGKNRNDESCLCQKEEVDPRLAVLKKLKLG
ncbi:MAG: hypothetical protein PWP04_324 [Candidatus Atribacteria bacterium]|nr:hypothetical protein [Candidatus Atribacteria bacterium]